MTYVHCTFLIFGISKEHQILSKARQDMTFPESTPSTGKCMILILIWKFLSCCKPISIHTLRLFIISESNQFSSAIQSRRICLPIMRLISFRQSNKGNREFLSKSRGNTIKSRYRRIAIAIFNSAEI